MWRLSGGCGEVVWKVWEGCLEGVGRLCEGEYGGSEDTEGCQTHLREPKTASLHPFKRPHDTHLDGVGRQFEGCEEAVWRVWEGCFDGVGRLF